jgi:CDP-paratose 2-epimerase
MSCIYGPHQFGTEDQGWVAHFLIRALDGEPIVVYGDGYQVRDILYVDDLVDAFLLVRRHIDRVAGEAFNVGGGASNTVSLVELLECIGEMQGRVPSVEHEGWRTGDQRWYVSDTRKLHDAVGWAPRTTVDDGLARLRAWLREARAAVKPAARLARSEPASR